MIISSYISPSSRSRFPNLIMMRIFTAILFYAFFSPVSGQGLSGLDKAVQNLTDSMYRHARFHILVNHVGFMPSAAKLCLTADTSGNRFWVMERKTGRKVYQGKMKPVKRDMGDYLVGDFSELSANGKYQIITENNRSTEFCISDTVYHDALRKMVQYFSLQRCGPSKLGWHAPCHLDDGVRDDNGKHQDVTGGWHDASDLRKIPSTVFGLIGLTRLLDLLHPAWDHGRIIEELRWGNRYFLRMQEPEGFLMNGIDGGQNYWTDNLIGTEDDRTIITRPAGLSNQLSDLTIQLCFVIGQSSLSRLVRDTDPDYADSCWNAAVRCFEWCRRTDFWSSPNEFGAAVYACLDMYLTSRDSKYKELADEYADRLLSLQVTEFVDKNMPVTGFFLTSENNPEPFKHRYILNSCWSLIGLCKYLELFPEHPQAARWLRAVEYFSKEYLARMCERSAFGIVPYGLYSKGDPGGNRRIGKYWYRWFMDWEEWWWAGINCNLASAGLGLVKASRILGNRKLAALAQRQLDWILGVNPYNASTVDGVGENQPKHYAPSNWNPNAYYPGIPVIPGGVMNGIGGTVDDRPLLLDGRWQTCEYWTPMVCYTMWLMAELQLLK
jgi:hypothetical protein